MKTISSLAMAGLVSLCLVSNALARAPFAQNVLPATSAIQNIIGPEHGDLYCPSLYAQCLKEAMNDWAIDHPEAMFGDFYNADYNADIEVTNACVKQKSLGNCQPLCSSRRSVVNVPWSFENGQVMKINFGCFEDEELGKFISVHSCKNTVIPFEGSANFDTDLPFMFHYCESSWVATSGLYDDTGGYLKASIDANGELDCLGVKKGQTNIVENDPYPMACLIDGDEEPIFKQLRLLSLQNTGTKCIMNFRIEFQN